MTDNDKPQESALSAIVRALDNSQTLRPQYLEMRALEVLTEMVAEGKAEQGPLDPWGSPTFRLDPPVRQEFLDRLWRGF